MRRSFLLAAVVLGALGLSCRAALADAVVVGESIKYATITIRGIHLGMDGKATYSALVQEYGKKNVRVDHTVCYRDYTRALKASKTSAPMNCMSRIEAQGPSDSISAILVEDFVNHEYGISRIDAFTYRQILKSDADRAAFYSHSIARFGDPGPNGNQNFSYYCSNLPVGSVKDCGGYFEPINTGSTDGNVRPNSTPYGYYTDAAPARNFGIEVHSNDGTISLFDYRDFFSEANAFSKAVNPQTTPVNF